jgi:hypothetical protein
VIREDTFVQSHQPYAVDLLSFRPRDEDHTQATIDAVWFRRRRGGWGSSVEITTVACAGYLAECLLTARPADGTDFMNLSADGRYGGHCRARWDGFNLWAPEMGEDERAFYKQLLVPMLANHPAIPEGFSGWWTFRVKAEVTARRSTP